MIAKNAKYWNYYESVIVFDDNLDHERFSVLLAKDKVRVLQ